MKKSIFLMTVFALIATSCVKENDSSNTTLKGRVYFNDDAISGVIVRVTNGSINHASTQTGYDGSFKLTIACDEISGDFYLYIDGGIQYQSKTLDLKGLGRSEFDYGNIYLSANNNLGIPSFEYGGCVYYVAPDPGMNMEHDEAVDYCDRLSIYNLYGWRLPDLNELRQMYSKRNSIGGFENTEYWCYDYEYYPSESVYYYHGLNFNNGSVVTEWEWSYPSYRVRPIRKAY